MGCKSRIRSSFVLLQVTASADGSDNLSDDTDAIVATATMYRLNPNLHVVRVNAVPSFPRIFYYIYYCHCCTHPRPLLFSRSRNSYMVHTRLSYRWVSCLPASIEMEV